jgi:hypothetical protein
MWKLIGGLALVAVTNADGDVTEDHGVYKTCFTVDNSHPENDWCYEFSAESPEQAQVYAEDFWKEQAEHASTSEMGKELLALQFHLERLRSTSGQPSEGLAAVKRFRNLKSMVLSLHPNPVPPFGRYCYYGCWCLPNGQHNLASGFGQPVDPLDQVCKEYAMCYKCIDIDFAGTCDPEALGYSWGRIPAGCNHDSCQDIECKNNPETNQNARCRRFICECDRLIALGIRAYHTYWNQSYHARWSTADDYGGIFVREDRCFPSGGQYRQDDCCGAYGTWSDPDGVGIPSRRPYATTNPATGCCQDVYMFDTTNQECCLDDSDPNHVIVKITQVGDGECDPSNVVAADAVDDFTTGDHEPAYPNKK